MQQRFRSNFSHSVNGMIVSSTKFIFVIHGVWLININIRPAQLSDVEGIFTVRTSVAENHLSREKMREMGITETTVSDMIKEERCAWVATDGD
ncbi:hypothetical protein PUG81_27965 [Erwiniaceae bacterium L1_54_6]|nr:hypothetical protein [Erwiniaceae bacterium L1_54_6]